MGQKHFEELKVSGKLPSPPGVGMEILRLTSKDDYSAEDIVKTLQKDPALTGRILQLANSAAMGSGQPVRTVRDATVRLGVRTVRSVALGVSLVSSKRSGSCPAFDYDLFWSESLARAVIARVFSERLRCIAPSEAFVCGLLSQLGCLALATVHPQSYAELLTTEYSGNDRLELCRLEEVRFRINHEEVGAAMFREWKLPDDFGAATQGLWGPPDPDQSAGLPLLMSAVVRIAAAFVSGQSLPLEKEVVEAALEKFERWKPDSISEVWEHAAEEWKRWGSMMEVKTSSVPKFDAEVKVTQQEAQPVAGEAGGSEQESLHFLVVDPDEAVAQPIVQKLQEFGHSVSVAPDGQAAMQVILQHCPRIVIAAQELPNMDGFQLCQALRLAEFGQGLYFLMLSNSDDTQNLVKAFEAGVDDYVQRPADIRILMARLRAGERVVRLQKVIEEDQQTMRAQTAELAILSRKLQKVSVTDALTQIPNRRYAMENLEMHWRRSVESNSPMTILMLDIDHFKKFNDTHGHDVGDEVLRQTAHVLQNSLRGADFVCRLGGEEFIVFLLNTSLQHGLKVAERLRSAVENNLFKSGSFEGNCKVSIGAATRTDFVPDPEQLLKQADEALYAAKEGGRNRVMYASR